MLQEGLALEILRKSLTTLPFFIDNLVTLDFVGDINLGGPVRYQHIHENCSYNKPFELVSKFLKESDLAIGNLESPFATKDMNKDAQVQFMPRLRADTDSGEALRYVR